MSSTQDPMWGTILEIFFPHSPRGMKSQRGFWRLPFSPWKEIKRPLLGNGFPCCFISSGLCSQKSTWLTAPAQKITITFLARALKCGLRALKGSVGSNSTLPFASRFSVSRRLVKAIPAKPNWLWLRKVRRSNSCLCINLIEPLNARGTLLRRRCKSKGMV